MWEQECLELGRSSWAKRQDGPERVYCGSDHQGCLGRNILGRCKCKGSDGEGINMTQEVRAEERHDEAGFGRITLRWSWNLQILCWMEDLQGKEMETCPSILAWKVPWTEEACGLQSMGSQTVRYTWAKVHTHTHVLELLELYTQRGGEVMVQDEVSSERKPEVRGRSPFGKQCLRYSWL